MALFHDTHALGDPRHRQVLAHDAHQGPAHAAAGQLRPRRRRPTGVVDTHTASPYFVLFRAQRPMRLLDVVDSTWVSIAGGNAAICSGPRPRAREWSRAIYRHYRTVDGIFYGASNLPPARAVALYERARPAMPARPELNLPLSHPGLGSAVGQACDRFGLPLT